MKRALIVLCVLGWLSPATSFGQEAEDAPIDDTPIREMVAAYAQAFNAKDANALAALWSPEAVYTNRMTGETVKGRQAIGEQFSEMFAANQNLKMELTTESIQFLSPSVAVEHGTANLQAPDSEPEVIQYTAVYVKSDGKWLLDRVTDEASPQAVSNYDHLKELEWIVGTWTTHAPAAQVQLDCHWTKNRNFLVRAFSVQIEDIDFSGMQIIGWDPAAETIRSWTFDSNGTFAEATWTNNGNEWVLHNKGVLADGQKASMVNIMRVVDENGFTWQTIERTAGGEILPNIDEVLIVRQ